MKTSTAPGKRLAIMAVLFFGLALWLVLPGLPFDQIGKTARQHIFKQDQVTHALSVERKAMLDLLLNQMNLGYPFSAEEKKILNNYNLKLEVSDLEADTLISRALYEYYIKDNALSIEQSNLLSRYKDFIDPSNISLADLKAHNRAVELKAPPQKINVAPTNDLCGGAEVIPAAGPFPDLTAITADVTDATTVGRSAHSILHVPGRPRIAQHLVHVHAFDHGGIYGHLLRRRADRHDP